MRLVGLNKRALERIRKHSQWDVDESGQAVPAGTTTAPSASGDVSQKVDLLEQKFNEQNNVILEWVDYLNQYNSQLADTINEVWSDVNTIADDVATFKEQVKPTQLPQKQTPTSYSDVYQGTMGKK